MEFLMMMMYRAMFLPVFLVLFPYYLWRMVNRGGYWEHFGERFGMVVDMPKVEEGRHRIWVQAVSVGEVKALSPIINRMVMEDRVEVVLTASSSTGYKLAKEMYGEKVSVVGYFPFDFWWCSWLAWGRYKPTVCVLMEGEIWPEHIEQARRRGVPVVLMNGRLSDKTYGRYLRIKWAARWLLGKLDRIWVGSEQDYERFKEIGGEVGKMEMMGNMKFDVVPGRLVGEEGKRELCREFGFMGKGGDMPFILLGSSTWAGEEGMMVVTLKRLLEQGVKAKLLLIPRHPERREEIERELRGSGLRYHFRSKVREARGEVDVYVADTIGEAFILGQVGDLAFIGKSMEPNEGGQTPIEGAMLGIPMVYGPRMSNFRQIAGELVRVGAAREVRDKEEGVRVMEELVLDEEGRMRMSKAGLEWHRRNQGAGERVWEGLKRVMGL